MIPALFAVLLAGCASPDPGAPPSGATPAALACPGDRPVAVRLTFGAAYEGQPHDAARAVEGLRAAGFGNLTAWTDDHVEGARAARWQTTTDHYEGEYNGTPQSTTSSSSVETWTYRVTGRNGTMGFATTLRVDRCAGEAAAADRDAQCASAANAADVYAAYFEDATGWEGRAVGECRYERAEPG